MIPPPPLGHLPYDAHAPNVHNRYPFTDPCRDSYIPKQTVVIFGVERLWWHYVTFMRKSLSQISLICEFYIKCCYTLVMLKISTFYWAQIGSECTSRFCLLHLEQSCTVCEQQQLKKIFLQFNLYMRVHSLLNVLIFDIWYLIMKTINLLE